jgi:monoamine oxidase
MNDSDILIIGAGACGLMAAYEISKTGKKVIVVEGQHRIGGRIHTIHDHNFLMPVETGAEFIHGDFPVTTSLLKEAGINYYPLEGKMFHFRNGELYKDSDFIEQSNILEKRMNELEEDMTINDFLQKYFPGEKYKDLRDTTRGFVEGYDAADADKASTFAFREEWSGGDMKQYRIEGGYQKLIDYLESRCKAAGVTIITGTTIKNISWHKNKVEAKSESQNVFHASKILITIPPLLLYETESKASIAFLPAISSKINAAENIGYGNVIKTTIQFNEAFWKSETITKHLHTSLEKLGFLLSDAFIPTWWTQLPYPLPILTGWLAGPKAKKLHDVEDEVILQEALHSLAFIFQSTAEDLEKKITAWNVTNWFKNPFSMGAYSYATLQSETARNELRQPVEDTIYFAGEALDNKGQSGTVEAALQDGKRAAQKMIS